MKKFASLLSSPKLSLLLLALFGLVIGWATFIENDFGTESARKLVYQSHWFEGILLLGCLNLIGLTFRYNMYSRTKLSLLLFHLAFVLIILGAGITRYFGSEGSMAIREGQTTAQWLSTESYLEVEAVEPASGVVARYPLMLAPASANRFSRRFHANGQAYRIKLDSYLPNAQRELLPDHQGSPWVHLITTGKNGRQDVLLQPGDRFQSDCFTLKYIENPADTNEGRFVYLFEIGGHLQSKAPFEISRLVMGSEQETHLAAGEVHELLPAAVYSLQGQALVVKQYLPEAIVGALPVSQQDAEGRYALQLSLTSQGVSYPVTLFGRRGQQGEATLVNFKGTELKLRYGSIPRRLPFALHLNDFILKRYPGSNSPSWFESRVQLIDSLQQVNREERIYMNHTLKYGGYRFYQSSYDGDEQGTILTVNRDGWGTFITYLGYLLMGLGMLWSLLNRNSRFVQLLKDSGINKGISQTVVLSFVLLVAPGLKAQTGDSLPVIPRAHAKVFGALRVQDNGGRIEPVNTLASEVLRKVCRSDSYQGQNPEQVVLGMLCYPERWQLEPMIRLNHGQLQQLMGVSGKRAAFIDFFNGDPYGGYSLRTFVEEANRRRPAYRSKFDNEVIRADERLNICYLVYSGAVFRFFPSPADSSHTWYSPLSAPGAFAGEDSVFAQHFLGYYVQEVRNSMQTGDWSLPNNLLKGLDKFQTTYGANVLPPTTRLKTETFYNNADLLNRITHIYLLAGLLLLFAQLTQVFIPSWSFKPLYRTGYLLIGLLFAAHTLALALRWYVAGHAPWSNGYEALTFIAWATVLAGILFYRKSDVALSSTAVLGALILQTAHLSWMDPQITNLVPVLQSYWLVVHVAVITASYGFLGLGALLAAINLLLLIFQTVSNRVRIDAKILQIQHVIEMTLIAGLYLLGIGTFLGGIWANESWGRYWGWDPKETWALVTVLVYAVVLHLRMVLGLQGRLLFTISALVSFGSVIMTYFGVNYYLSGLHSYAAGDPLPVPPVVYYSVGSVALLSALAVFNQLRLRKLLQNTSGE